jgi:opacity protein-like surface antigen
MRRLVIPLALLAVLTAPAPARAQGFLSGFAGYDYGESAGNCPSFFNDCSERRRAYGVTFGKLSGGVLGFEQDISWAPNFFGEGGGVSESSVFTAMSNLVVALPLGPVRPYGSLGAGLIKTKVGFSVAELADFGDTSLGWDMGVGVMVLLPAHLGVRVDFRRFRTAGDLSFAGIGLQNDKLRFSRVTVGLVLH